MRRSLGLLVVVLLATVFAAPLRSQHAHTMPIAVLDDRVNIGGEFVPRFLDLPVTFVSAAGDAPTILASGTYDYVEIGGVVTVSAGSVVNITHAIVLPGGALIVECGVTINGRNVTINTARDPFQWGNGLLNFGALRSVCPEKTPFVEIEAVQAGATTITFRETPIGWAVGDELVLPDTRQVTGTNQPRREPATTIAAMSGLTVTLSRPLAFARENITRPDGSLVKRPEVVNLTRRTVIKSEDPDGVRWHHANIGSEASWDIVGTAFVEMGRTRPVPLSNTSLGSNIGTNQVGRYGGLHNHHNGSSLVVRRANANAFVTTRTIAKWGGITLHQTHDTENIGNVCVGFNACFVTEDGNEVRNVFRGNFAAYGPGVGGVGGEVGLENVRANNPGAESCYWFRGVHNVIEGNHAWNCQSGMDLFNFSGLQPGATSPVPTVKGGPLTTVLNLPTTVPISFKDNVTVGNTDAGMVYWQLVRFPNERLISAHNALKAMWSAQPNGPSVTYLVDSILMNANGVGHGIASSNGYNQGVETLRGEVRGFDRGGVGGLGGEYGRFTETVFQNTTDFYFENGWPAELTFTNVRSEPFGGRPHRFFFTIPILVTETNGWFRFRGESAPALVDWNGTTDDYRLVSPSQARATPTPRSDQAWAWHYPAIECGPTLGDVWDRCGFGINGAPFADAVPLPGIVNMVAVPEPRPSQNGTPKAILTSPRADAPAQVRPDYGFHILMFALTGDPNAADDRGYFSINGGPRQMAGRVNPHWAWFWYLNPTDGVKNVRTWREQNGAEVPGSSMTFCFGIGTTCGSTPPPPPPPPPPRDCELSAAVVIVGQWTRVGNTYVKTTSETKTVLIEPEPGGTPCQP